MTALPEWVDPEAWTGFKAMRKQIKKPMTDRAEKLILAKLYEIKAEGHDPNACLDASTVNCWAGVFAPKAAAVRPNYGDYVAPPKPTQEEREASEAARIKAMQRLSGSIRLKRVA